MRGKLLLPIVGLAVIIIGVFALWYSGLNRTPMVEPPIPENLESIEPALLDMIHQTRSSVLEMPKDAQRWLKLGMIYEGNNNNAFARICYEQSIELDSRCAQCWYHTAQVRYATSDYDLAIEALRRTVELQNDYAPAKWRLGLWLLDQGDIAGAEDLMLRATQQAPRDAAGWFGLARIRMQQDRNEEAREILENVLQWTPFNRFYGNQLLGTVYRRLGRIEDAERVLLNSSGREIVWPDPWSREISNYHRGAGWKIELPMIYLGQGRIAEAIQMLEGFLRRDPDNSVLLSQLAIAFRTDGQLDRSIETIKRAIELKEHYQQAHFNLGLAYLMKAEQANEPGEIANYERLAMEHADFSLEVNPAYPLAHGLRAQLLERQLEYDEALEEYQVAGKDIDSGQHWLGLLGKLQLKLGRWDEAAGTFELILIRYPPQPDVLYDLAIAQLNTGQRQQAERTADQYARFWPNDQRVVELRREIQSFRPAGAAGPQPDGG